MQGKRISWEERDHITWLGFGHQCDKSMTVLDTETLEELDSMIEKIKKMPALKGVVFFTHKERCFLAGADIKMIDQFDKESTATEASSRGQTLFNKIESLDIPTLACIHGICLGGGTEFALACNTILVSDAPSTQMGLPEVKLGLLPGLGGTWRLPKRVGFAKALEMILTGKSIRSARCVQWGLAEESYPSERLLDKAPQHLSNKTKRKNTFSEKHFGSQNHFSKSQGQRPQKNPRTLSSPLENPRYYGNWIGTGATGLSQCRGPRFRRVMYERTVSKSALSLFPLGKKQKMSAPRTGPQGGD